MILGAYSLSNLAGNLVVGPVLDRRGPLWPLTASLAATSLVLAGYAAASSPEGLLGLRLLHGLVAAAIVPAVFMAAAGERAGRERPLGRMGALGATIGLAAVVGPPAAGVVSGRAGFPAVYLLLASLFAATALGMGAAGLAGRLGRGVPARTGGGVGPTLGSVLRSAGRRGLFHAWAGAGSLVFAVGSLALLLPLGLVDGAGERASLEAGKLLGIFSVAATVSMVVLARLRRRLSPAALLALSGGGLALMALSLAGIASPLGGAGGLLAFLLVLLGVGFGLAFPSLSAGIALRAPPEARGRGYALFYAAFSAGAFLGPASAGLLGAATGVLPLGYLPAVALAGGVGAACVGRGIRERGAGPASG